MSLSFSYRKEIFGNKTRFFPKIPAVLQSKGHAMQTPALLDSGATDIFIPKEIAESLELELKKPTEAESWSGKFTVFESAIGIIVGKSSQTFRQVLPCLVPKEKTENAEVVFGRSFFQFFEITFDEANKITRLKQPSKKVLE